MRITLDGHSYPLHTRAWSQTGAGATLLLPAVPGLAYVGVTLGLAAGGTLLFSLARTPGIPLLEIPPEHLFTPAVVTTGGGLFWRAPGFVRGAFGDPLYATADAANHTGILTYLIRSRDEK